MRLNVLILGGTREGRQLAEQLAPRPDYRILLSYAGRTESLQRPSLPHRVGGFGGVEGLARFLREGDYHALIDATHPFAARMSENAVAAVARTATPLLRLLRPAWQKVAGDGWIEVAGFDAAARALGEAARRVFLTVGRQELAAFSTAPQHDYLVRAVDPFDPPLPRARVLAARGPFALEHELALLARERVEVIVSKNAGGDATYAKIEAARRLSLPVVMVQRPRLPAAEETAALDGVLAWLAALHRSLSLRGA